MSSPIPEPPFENQFVWFTENKQAIIDLVRQHNAMASAKIAIVSTRRAQSESAFTVADGFAELRLPLQFSTSVSQPSGGSTIDTQCRAALNALLARLSEIGLNR